MSIKCYKYTEKNSFDIRKVKTKEKGEFASREEALNEFVENLKEINVLQQKLYAERKEGVIFVFQAMDAAGKDGCIRTVFGTLTPHGVNEFCFKAPSSEELSHDYLWRFWQALPARGNISIFNRSYYEDVLVGKVHKLYENQVWPERMKKGDIIEKRYREINDFENYLYNNATRVVKIFLNVSKDEQAKRFISRIDTQRKNWKVSENDIRERQYWDEYQDAFECMINETASKRSPWYVVPADHKWYARLIVSRIILETLREMNPQFPTVSDDFAEKMKGYREELAASLSTAEENKEKNKGKSKKAKVHKHKKHKKHKKHEKNGKREEKIVDNQEETCDAVVDNAFINTATVVTDAYVEEEKVKIQEKKENEEVDASAVQDNKAVEVVPALNEIKEAEETSPEDGLTEKVEACAENQEK